MFKLLNLFKKKKKQILEMPFEGFSLLYSEGTSIVERFKRDGAYEPEFMDHLVDTLNQKNGSKLLLDIGANIGMVSLTCLNRCNDLKVVAFEPGLHQFELLKGTLVKNNLGNKLSLSSIALSNSKGTVDFHVHSADHASGDGFIDTGRAGKTSIVKVNTDTLDNWWNQNNRPHVDVIKIDTEGAEYYILQGANEMITALSPIIYLEINDKNIRNYPFEIVDLLNQVSEMEYSITNLNLENVTDSNIVPMIRMNDTFIIRPKTQRN